IRSIAVNSEGVLFAGARNDGIYRSRNNGETWERVFTGLVNGPGQTVIEPNKIAVKDGNVVIVGTDTAFFRSVDGGTTWEWALIGGNSGIIIYALTVAPNGDFFATGGTLLYRSSNNGATWGVPSSVPPTAARALAATSGAVFASSNGNVGVVHRSLNNGSTWL